MIWFLCNAHKPYDISRFEHACQTMNVEMKVVDPLKLQIIQDKTFKLYYDNVEINKPDYLLHWNGCMISSVEEQIETVLTKMGTIVCNSFSEISNWKDKFKWQVSTPLNVVKSMKIQSHQIINCINIIEQEFQYPLVIKGDVGSLGIGVYKVYNRNNLIQLSEVIMMLDKNYKMHLEQFIDYKEDVRMYIIGQNYYLMKRVNDNDFRANYSNGAQVSKYARNALTDKVFNEIRKEYCSLVIGVDILITTNGYYICELNSAPSFKGLEETCDNNIASQIIKEIYESK